MRTTTLFLILALFAIRSFGQSIPSPKEHFGFNIGDNYRLANYTQTEAYFKKIAAASDRAKLVDIGKTEEGRTQYMMIVSSPENIKNLDKYKNIAQKLARAENTSDAEAKRLADEGKTVVWIDGGLHATETVGTHQLIESIWQTVSRKDPETLRLLDKVIILFVHANPDGQELVSNWYMREPDTLKRSLSQLPRLYEKYIGHDNNRDFFMNNMSESKNISRQLYVEWLPQILYNHHQTGPPGSVVAGPPYRDPFNYVYDPIVVTSLDAVGAAMINRLNAEGKPGYTQRNGSVFSTWWNGGLRTTAYFHNVVGILTEIIGSPTPASVPLVPERLLPNAATPFPVTPQKWLYKQSIDYSVSLNYAVLDHAARNSEHLLYNIYLMGKNSIEKGSRNNWTLSPSLIDSVSSAAKKEPARSNTPSASPANEENQGFGGRPTTPVKYYDLVFKDSTLRDARGYILPADQPDFAVAVKFLNALIESGIKVHRATADFTVEGKKYPAGSYVVLTNQAFRPHVLDMFEPQDHPNDFLYPGGPPVRPYDAAGWTPAFTMGFTFDRILNGFSGPFEAVPYGAIQAPKGNFQKASTVAGYILDARSNNSFIAVNDLLQAGATVYRVTNATNDNIAQGSFFVPATTKPETRLEKAAADLNLQINAVAKQPTGLEKVAPLRIALWDVYGGSMPSGWVRWLMEQYHFPFKRIFAQEIDAGNLKQKYDVIVFVGGAIPALGARSTQRDTIPANIPAEFRDHFGRITADKSIPPLKAFLEAGGNIVTIGSSTNLAYHLKLPVRNALVEVVDGKERTLPGEKFYIPGSVMQIKVDAAQPAAWGVGRDADVFFQSSPVFNVSPEALSKGMVTPIAWFDSAKTLRSGWAWGQGYLRNGVAAFVAKVGTGKLYAFGPEITFRGQTQKTFKFLFNELYQGVKN